VKGFLDVNRSQLRKLRTAAENLSTFCLWGGEDGVSSNNSMYKTYWNGLYDPLHRTLFHPSHRVISLARNIKNSKTIRLSTEKLPAMNSGFDSFKSIVECVVLSLVSTTIIVSSMITKHCTPINQIAAIQYTRD
jgi:hypothetical protein